MSYPNFIPAGNISNGSILLNHIDRLIGSDKITIQSCTNLNKENSFFKDTNILVFLYHLNYYVATLLRNAKA